MDQEHEARHAEIARRYARHYARHAPHRGRVAAVRRRQILALLVCRYGIRALPEDHLGRAMLRALLACGMNGPEARQCARWISEAELQSTINQVDALPKRHWTPERLGNLVELTDEERQAGKLWSMRPCDVEWHVIQKRVRERKKARDRDRQRKRREVLKMAKDLDDRGEALICALGQAWTSVSELATKTKHSRAFHAPNGQPIAGASLRRVINRSLDELAKRNLIESRSEPGRNGLPTRFVRRSATWRRRVLSPRIRGQGQIVATTD